VHNNFYFLRHLTQQLDRTLNGTVISECFSQNREEMVIRLETESAPFFIKASLSPQFSCLSFPSNFHRAKKNSVDLFQALIGQRVEHFRQYENERSFAMSCSNHYSLLFKMHGNRSNLILFHSREVQAVFKTGIVEDEKLKLDEMDRSIDWSYEYFLSHSEQPETIYFTFGKIVWKYLRLNGFDELSIEQKWSAIHDVRRELEHAKAFYTQEASGKVFLSLVKVGTTIKKSSDPIEAVTVFYNYYTQQDAFVKEKAAALALLESKRNANASYVIKTQRRLEELEQHNSYKVWADLLMANLHAIAPGLKQVTLPDFYHDNRQIEIKLKPDLNAQKNAAIFYKKGKNQQLEIHHLQKLLANKREQSSLLAELHVAVKEEQDIKNLRKLIERIDIDDSKKKVVALPYREVEFNGYMIWIGRNAISNDTLTLKFGYKEDLWLHAKDVAGSHVLVKHQAGKTFPRDVIERAAQLAAYYSKRKNESLCPVVVIPKKYVRKRKGDPPGVVVVEKEEVIMVEPRA
jgi:predicted ribosome quality control (RQC) complex YloA/Tae2 family protein